MAQYFTDFSEYTTGVVPSDWTGRWSAANVTYSVVETSGTFGGKALRLSRGNFSSQYSLLSWDVIDSDPDRADVEILTRLRFDSEEGVGNSHAGVTGRGSGLSPDGNGYAGFPMANAPDENSVRIIRRVTGTGTEIGVTPKAWDANVWYWVRMRINGTSIQLKRWSGQLADEPVSFDVDVTDSDIAAAGWVGAHILTPEFNADYDVFAVGTNGDPAVILPELVKAEAFIDTALMSVQFNQPVLSNGLPTIDASGGDVTATLSSGDGTGVLLYSLSRNIVAGETVTLDYAAGSILALGGSSAIAAVSAFPVSVVEQYPHLADEIVVAAVNPNLDSYEVTRTVTNGVRYSIGAVWDEADDDQQATFSVDIGGGFVTIDTFNIDGTLLPNRNSDFFEDGVVWTATIAGEVTFRVASAVAEIRGVVIREADTESGIVEDQGTGVHCWPLALIYSGNGGLYQVHAEMYSGEIHLSKDGVPLGKIFDAIATDRNEHYHNGCWVQEHPNGIVVGQVGHNEPNLRFRFLPDGDFAQISGEFTAGGGTSSFTYAHCHVRSNGEVLVLTRGNTNGSNFLPIFVRVQNIDQIDTAGTTATFDILAAGTEWWYPRSFELLDDGAGTEVACILFNTRGVPDLEWANTEAVLCALDQGSFGEWYSINGDPATVIGSLGTEGSPRFNDTQVTTQTSAGDGIRLLPKFGAGDTSRYVPQGALWQITQFPIGSAAAMGAVSFIFYDHDANETDYTASPGTTTVIRWCVHNEGTRFTAPTDFDAPPGLQAPNNYRLDMAFGKDFDGNDMFAFTDRGQLLLSDTYDNPIELYWNWGTNTELVVFQVDEPFSNLITFTERRRIEVSPDVTSAFLTTVSGEDRRFIYQKSLNHLHETHGQTQHSVEWFIDPPELVSATIGASGSILSLVFDEPVTGSTAPTLTATGGDVTATFSGGSGTDTLLYDLSRPISAIETVTLDYTPGDIQDLTGNPLGAIADFPVTNNSALAAFIAVDSISKVPPLGASIQSSAICDGTNYAEFNAQEESSFLIKVALKLVGFDGELLPVSGIAPLVDSIELTLIELASGQIVNGRQAQNVLNANGGTLDANGVFTFEVTTDDTAVVNVKTGVCEIERHLATFTVTWDTTRKTNWQVLLRVENQTSVPQGV